ncbi:hypothetical protein IMCC21906_00058 [Spongiibacter sp. IMCC21906]|uniref:hypothetical protein n=1 Tax=Spongiibacter sp. IMCC21906 TaxID=1620392 RepID=UPI00062DF687|nr:hypothetical protein [Spongiibacter sp. IMCC21906]AKH67753.1 hypothetical protein IMCC21906_00058 [Spongiibacter sp. IMCC21906]
MDLIEYGLAILALTLVVLVYQGVAKLSQQTQALSLRLREDAARLLELRYQQTLQWQMEDAQEFVETFVESGTATVRGLHMGISRIPFGMLEANAMTRDTGKVVRETHDLISDVVYGSIRGVNKSVGILGRSVLGAKPKGADKGLDKSANKHRPLDEDGESDR